MKRRIVTLLLVLSIATISITACGNKEIDNTLNEAKNGEMNTMQYGNILILDMMIQ